MPNQALLEFYGGTGLDSAGRTIEEVWAFDHERLEGVHDYIQWLFPSAQPSQFNKAAPLLDAETADIFRDDRLLKARVLRSLRLLLDFYGLELVDSPMSAVTVRKAKNYALRRANWQDAPAGKLNHNLLRLTRIQECLRNTGLEPYARALFGCLAEIQREQPQQIPEPTLVYWSRAAAG